MHTPRGQYTAPKQWHGWGSSVNLPPNTPMLASRPCREPAEPRILEYIVPSQVWAG